MRWSLVPSAGPSTHTWRALVRQAAGAAPSSPSTPSSGKATAISAVSQAWMARSASVTIVSNQARIARGEIAEAEVRRRFEWANTRLGHPFTDWRLCPHAEEDGCACRKPRPAMFLDLARRHAVDLPASVHVGDSPKHRDAAAAAGIGTFRWAREFFGW